MSRYLVEIEIKGQEKKVIPCASRAIVRAEIYGALSLDNSYSVLWRVRHNSPYAGAEVVGVNGTGLDHLARWITKAPLDERGIEPRLRYQGMYYFVRAFYNSSLRELITVADVPDGDLALYKTCISHFESGKKAPRRANRYGQAYAQKKELEAALAGAK